MKSQQILEKKLETIRNVFDIDKVLNLKTDKKYIQKYYRVNKIPYSLFHTKTDLIHMAISKDGTYKEDDLLVPVKTVEKHITTKTDKVLELATGRGANSVYLAQKHPKIKFYGIDISKGQLDFAFKKAKKIKNYYPDFGDYHDLSRFENESFDIVFVIESLCYSTDKTKVIKEVNRVLKKEGIFVVIDGYLNKDLKQLTPDERIASKLVEKGMAVDCFETYSSFVDCAKKNKFIVYSEENVSKFIAPNMHRLEKKADLFFKFSLLSKSIKSILPKEFVYNAISGYLFSELMKLEVCTYMITVLKKNRM